MLIRFSFFLFLLLFATNSVAQDDSLAEKFSQYVVLDSLVVTAKKSGFNKHDFIKMVMEDESFYKAFRNLRFSGYAFKNDISIFNKKGRRIASYKSDAKQIWDGQYRSMSIRNEEISGKYYKRNGDYRYYTSELYDRLFFTKGKKREKKVYTDPGYQGDSKMGKHIYELKKLIFSPGSKSEVPLIGKKTALFDESMTQYYDYSIESKKFRNGDDCYVFIAEIKPTYLKQKENKTVIKYLATYFKKEDFQVLGRKYQLAYGSAAYRFDVNMDIELTQSGGLYYPVSITYDGFWNIPVRKPEIATFNAHFSEFYTK